MEGYTTCQETTEQNRDPRQGRSQIPGLLGEVPNQDQGTQSERQNL